MKKLAKNPGELTCEERLAEVLTERDRASATCMGLIELADRLIAKLKESRYSAAQDEAREAELRLAKLRRAK